MTHHNGYSEEWRGTGGPTIYNPSFYADPEPDPEPTISANRIRAIEANRDLLRSELLLATAKPRHPVRNACITALIFGLAGFWAGRASAAPQCDNRDRVVALLADKYGATQDRFLALRKAAVGEGALTIDAQNALLRIVRSRAESGGLV